MKNVISQVLFSDLRLIFNELQIRMDKPHIKFFVQVDSLLKETEVLTDKVKLSQILINLISNALKFTVSGKVECKCSVETNKLNFEVSDTGIGIPENKQKFIFERFAQIENIEMNIHGGTGLGLPIVKGLVNLLNGKLWLKSIPDQGSTFSFSIPLKKATDTPITKPEFPINYNINYQDKTILIVEDDPINADYLKELLIPTKACLEFARNGKEAIHMAVELKPHLIFMDIGLPDITGYEAVIKIKQHSPGMKIIAQTAYATNEDKEKALNVGCAGYISKPLKAQTILSILNQYLK
ncbi:MAG: response regulator [Bacteroidales bacterium]|nr:response regulator [Bacteroidales bacterium]